MKIANVAELKNNLSKYIAIVEMGEEVEICKRNIPIAVLVPIANAKRNNRTILGCGKGSVIVHSDLTEPLIPEESWEMLHS